MGSAAELLLADGRFPAGGHAHSGGLEAAVAAGLDEAGVPAFLAGRLGSVAACEAALAAAALGAAARGRVSALLALDGEALARCASPPLRLAARRLGAQLLRTASAVWPEDATLAAYRAASGATPRPVAFGVVAAAAELDPEGCARAWLHDDAATVATAAVRLLSGDPAVAARWVRACGPRIDALAVRAAEAAGRAPRDLPAAFAPALEARSLDHARRKGRLFAT